jgi:hypothetical protein
MGDFSNGVNQDNNMLGEMRDYNSEIKEHLNTRNNILDGHLKNAREEKGEVANPEKLGATATQLGQIGTNYSAAKVVLGETYGGSKAAYAAGLGRTGTETTFGLKPAVKTLSKGVSKVGEGYQALTATKRAIGAVPEGSSSVSWGGATAPPTPEGLLGSGADEARFAGANPARPTGELAEGTYASSRGVLEMPVPTEGEPITATLKSGSSAGKVVTAGADLSKVAPSGLRAGAGVAADLVGKAGVGLGILAGGEALMTDITGHGVQGDNTAEKWGNRLSIAGGALDTLGLAVPPLAILGGIAGVASAIFSGEGHLQHASAEKTEAEEKKKTPGETAMQVTSMASLGQVASRGTDIHASIAGTSAF